MISRTSENANFKVPQNLVALRVLRWVISPFLTGQIPSRIESMQQKVSIRPGSPLDLDNRPPFKVVTAYEDFEMGKHAKHIYDFLTQNLGADCEFSNQMWKFDVLSIPKLREIATKDAFEADILMISSRGGRGLAVGVKAWIESWLAQGTCAIALVALFCCEIQESQTIRAYLADVARRGGLEFFAQPDCWPGNERTIDDAVNHWRQAMNEKVPMPASYVPPQVKPTARWGLNE
jgi:hypothetical protein